MQFDRPRGIRTLTNLFMRRGKRMLARRPELTMELITSPSQEKGPTRLKIRALKGKKYVFRDDILINDIDVLRIKKYFQENFVLSAN
jgi:hypothetical protein